MEELRDKHRKLIATKVFEKWESRLIHQGLNKKHKKTKQLQAEFLLGAVVAFDALRDDDESCIPAKLLFSVMRGDYIEFK